MSLSYSLWQETQAPASSSAPSRKRIPSIGMRKTVKSRPYDNAVYTPYEVSHPADEESANNEENMRIAETFDVTQEKQLERGAKVHQLLDNLTGFSERGGGELGDFNPMPYPPKRIPSANIPNKIVADEPIESPGNPLMPKTRAVLSKSSKPENEMYYRPSSSDAQQRQYTNYRDAYNRESMVSGILGETKRGPAQPYYSAGGNDKITEKLNYLIQMMEGLQMEKTSHITEEFILYCLLGTFMIYIVDGFSRGGKYIR